MYVPLLKVIDTQQLINRQFEIQQQIDFKVIYIHLGSGDIQISMHNLDAMTDTASQKITTLLQK